MSGKGLSSSWLSKLSIQCKGELFGNNISQYPSLTFRCGLVSAAA